MIHLYIIIMWHVGSSATKKLLISAGEFDPCILNVTRNRKTSPVEFVLTGLVGRRIEDLQQELGVTCVKSMFEKLTSEVRFGRADLICFQDSKTIEGSDLIVPCAITHLSKGQIQGSNANELWTFIPQTGAPVHVLPADHAIEEIMDNIFKKRTGFYASHRTYKPEVKAAKIILFEP